jgi:hypothetical protein
LATITLLLILSNAGMGFAVIYGELRSAGIKRCGSIDSSAYQSGLAFNPDGYRSYYVRSECFQRVAVEFRDERLCSQVQERWSLFSSSWGYSKSNCQKLVRDGIAADRKALEEKKSRYLQSPVRLRDFRIEPNGNGRDFDIIPSFSGERADGYSLRFDILIGLSNSQSVLLHSSGYYIDVNSNLRLYVRQQDIRARFPQFALNHVYVVRANLVLSIGIGGQRGKWSDEFIENVFPAKDRTQIMAKEISFRISPKAAGN